MVSRSMQGWIGRLLVSLVLAVASLGCSSAKPAGGRTDLAARCRGDDLAACERALAAARAAGQLRKDAVVAYVESRATRDPTDAWARLWRDLSAKPAAVAIVLEARPDLAGSAEAAARSASPLTVRAIAVPALPAPAAVSADELAMVFGDASGLEQVVVAGARARSVFPADPLAPLLAGLPAVIEERADLGEIERGIRLGHVARRALRAASDFDYVGAASRAEELSKLLAGAPPDAGAVLRARFALDRLNAAGLVLEADDTAAPAPNAAPQAPAAPSASAAAGTPYEELLRVRLAKDPTAEWKVRRARVLAALPQDHHAAMDAWHAASWGCAGRLPPPMAGPGDLVFAPLLSAALATDDGAGGSLPLPAWLERYEAMVDAVDEARSTWAHVVFLLHQRGETAGLSAAGTPLYKRVTELAAKHLGGLEALQRAHPTRYPVYAQLALAYTPGLVSDDVLRERVIALSRSTVQDRLARAGDAGAIFETVLAGALAGMQYPPAIQAAHYLALQGAFTAKLKGDLTKQTGWSVAGLYAADAAVRLMTGQTADLPFSSAQITRALGDPALEQRSLGPLATSVAQYAALGLSGKLDLEPAPDRLPADRARARASLADAIRSLSPDERGPENVTADVVLLADGTIAALSATQNAPAKTGAQCDRDEGPAPNVRRALARLGDVRRRLLLHPRLKADGAWSRRVRPIVLVLSDAIDLMLAKKNAPVAFTIARADADAWLTKGLADWDERAAADGLSALYLLVRDYKAARDAEVFLRGGGRDLQRVLAAAVAFFRADDTSPAPAPGLLESLAKVAGKASNASDAAGMLRSMAESFYAEGKVDQGDLLLVGALGASAIARSVPDGAVLDLAAKHKSRIEWALRFLVQVGNGRRGLAPEATAFAGPLKKALEESCEGSRGDDVVAVMAAMRSFADGKKKEARAALDDLLDRADKRGLRVPKMTYKYEERTRSRIFVLSLSVSTGAGVLQGANSFQIGLGARTAGEPGGSMTAALAPLISTEADEEAARYYVHVAALAAAYHLLDGDTKAGARAASRAVGALLAGVRLGDRSIGAPRTVDWGGDSSGLLALDAQLAAEAGQPFLAGDLWAVVRATLPHDADDAAVEETLATLPLGLAAVKEAGPAIERARKSLRIVAHPLACTEAKVELGGFEEPSCDAYPLALSLRIADALKKMPRLARAGSGVPRCASMRAIDAFLGAMDKATYDPDALGKALAELGAEGKTYDAAVLLTRHRQNAHCTPALVGMARQMAKSEGLSATHRADLLSVAVNCAAPSIEPALVEDLLALDREASKLADPSRALRVMLFSADLAARDKRWDVLDRVTSQEDFVRRWMRTPNATAATVALLLEHAATVLSGRKVALEKTADSAKLLCETVPAGDRAPLCADVAALRAPDVPEAQRKKRAEDAVKQILTKAP